MRGSGIKSALHVLPNHNRCRLGLFLIIVATALIEREDRKFPEQLNAVREEERRFGEKVNANEWKPAS